MANKLIDYYDRDKWKGHIEERVKLLQREEKSLSLILQEKPKGKILDIGCGDGLFLKHLRDVAGKKYSYHGVDYSKFNVDLAVKSGFDVKKCNIENGIPFEDGYFDIVYAAELIEHVVDPDFFLEECFRLLKPGGLIILSTPNLTTWYNRILFTFGMHPMFVEFSTKSPKVGSGVMKKIKKASIPVGHIRIFTVNALKDLLKAQGFTIKIVKGANFGALPGPVVVFDTLVARLRPKLASNIIIVGVKEKKKSGAKKRK